MLVQFLLTTIKPSIMNMKRMLMVLIKKMKKAITFTKKIRMVII